MRALLGIVAATATFALPTAAPAATDTFAYTGSAQPWVVPAGVTSVTFDLYGAQGGGGAGDPSTAGKGARVVAPLPVVPGETLMVYVGGRGTALAGGFNGGGRAFGGGATDVRRTPYGLVDRLAVAAGGGGNSYNNTGLMGVSHEGGHSGERGASNGGGPGTAAAGGDGGNGGGPGSGATGAAGTLGQGGNGAGSSLDAHGGGGGGGLYGGGGGGFLANIVQATVTTWGGGGGSSRVPLGGGLTDAARLNFGTASVTYAAPTGGSPSGGSGSVPTTPATPGTPAPTKAPAVTTPALAGSTSAGSAQPAAGGGFTIPKQTVDCSGTGPDCVVTVTITVTVKAGKARAVKLGTSTFRVASGKKAKVRAKLTKKGRSLLKRKKRLNTKASITVKRGTKTAKKTVKLRLKR